MPSDFLRAVKQIDYSSGSAKINVLLNELPNFKAVSADGVGPQHKGTIHISPTLDYMERAWEEAEHGYASTNPILEITIPSAVDPTIAPSGKHIIGMFVQYAPYMPRNGGWDDSSRNAFADRCLEILSEYAPNIQKSVVQRQTLMPPDIEREFGQISHTDTWLVSLRSMHPSRRWRHGCVWT